ncbi:MAG: acyl-CoA reductase [Polyangiales bacterium]
MERDTLQTRARELIEKCADGERHDETRDTILRDLALYQRDRIPSYARLFAEESSIVPAMPTDVFRFQRLATHPPEQDVVAFFSSGTTDSAKSAHYFRDLNLYDLAAHHAAKRMLFPDTDRIDLLVLAASTDEAPHSSLSYMLHRFSEWFGATTTYAWRNNAIDLHTIRDACNRAICESQPLAILGTSFAFVHALDAIGSETFALARGSRIMTTGGYKGRSREVDPMELRRSLSMSFGVDQRFIVSEYGMTELSSQLYETSLRDAVQNLASSDRRFWIPGWMRVTAVDPDTLKNAAEGARRLTDRRLRQPRLDKRHSNCRSRHDRQLSPRFTRSRARRDASRLLTRRRSCTESAMTPERRAQSIANACTWLRDRFNENDTFTEKVAATTGLHPKMVKWGAQTTFETFEHHALSNLQERAALARADLSSPTLPNLGVILAGNLFTSPARACFLPLLFGCRVSVKASAQERTFPALLKQALDTVDEELASALTIHEFDRHDIAALQQFTESIDILHAYGSNETMKAVRNVTRKGVKYVEHGHGFGVAIIDTPSLQNECTATNTATSLSLDIAAYDQLGCLSPTVAFVRADQPFSPHNFAQLLHRALDDRDRNLPRGILPIDAGAAQIQWRGVSLATGALFTGATHAVHLQSSPLALDAPVRFSPGYRNISLIPFNDLQAVVHHLHHFGDELKCVGTDVPSIDAAPLRALHHAPIVCAFSEMQRPTVDIPADGRLPYADVLPD